jgi:hypothetical protein
MPGQIAVELRVDIADGIDSEEAEDRAERLREYLTTMDAGPVQILTRPRRPGDPHWGEVTKSAQEVTVLLGGLLFQPESLTALREILTLLVTRWIPSDPGPLMVTIGPNIVQIQDPTPEQQQALIDAFLRAVEGTID